MAQLAVYNRTYDETVDLMVEARDYLAQMGVVDRYLRSPTDGLRVSCEAMRVTSRLAQVLAWLMYQRAVQTGELTLDAALDESHSLSDRDVCCSAQGEADGTIPQPLCSLLLRSRHLYMRISNLEQQIRQRSMPFLAVTRH